MLRPFYRYLILLLLSCGLLVHHPSWVLAAGSIPNTLIADEQVTFEELPEDESQPAVELQEDEQQPSVELQEDEQQSSVELPEDEQQSSVELPEDEQQSSEELPEITPDGWSGDRYYVNGTYLVGLHKIDGKFYYFTRKGHRKENSWVKFDDGRSFFDKNGVRVNGWKKIEGKYYHFKKYLLQTNTIAGTKKTGQFYVDSQGVRVTDNEVKRAVKYVLKYSDAKADSLTRLHSCMDHILTYNYIPMSYEAPKAKELPGYAEYLFSHKSGNCYRFASAFCYIAKVLGYPVRMAAGGMTTVPSRGKLTPHGWCEVKINGKWNMMDLTMQRKNTRKLCFLTRKKYPFDLRVNYEYTLAVKDGQVSWTRKKNAWSNTKLK